MKRETLIFFLGFVIVLMPFLGIPSAWKRMISIVLGLVFVLVGYQLRRNAYLRAIENNTGERKTDVYVEQVERLFIEPEVKSRRGKTKEV